MHTELIDPAPGGARSHWIDVLRGLAILAVVLMHIDLRIPVAKSPLGSQLAAPVSRALFHNGYYAVKVFFVISGFLITANILRRWGSLDAARLGTFYRLRFARIAPCLAALLAILAILHGFGVPGFGIDPAKTTLSRALFSAVTFHLNVLEIRVGYLPANWDVLWSLSIEEAFYFGYPLLCRFLPDRRLLILVGAGLVLAGPFARTTWAGGNELAEDKAYLAGFDCIAIGCAAASLSARIPAGARIRGMLRWIGILLMVQISVYPLVRIPFWRYGLDVTILALGTGALLAGLGAARPGSSWNPLAWLGRYSYEVYLTHGFVMIFGLRAFRALGSDFDSAPYWYLALSAASAALGWAVARLYSEPLNLRLRR